MFLDIPASCNFAVPKVISPERLLQNQEEICSEVLSAVWFGTISPASANVSAYIDDTWAYEEIQLFRIVIDNTDNLYDIARAIYRAVRYPCLLVIQYKEKYLLSGCKFELGKRDPERNILHTPAFSHWLHDSFYSHEAENFLRKIESLLNTESSLKEMYQGVVGEIQMFALGGIGSKQYLVSIIKWLRGSCSLKYLDTVLSICTPYKKYSPRNGSIAAKYEKSRATKQYTYSYDAEDVWYFLMMNEETRRIIETRKYRNLEEIIYRMENMGV